jgi:N-acetylmuramoyl-L-alanine amidase
MRLAVAALFGCMLAAETGVVSAASVTAVRHSGTAESARVEVVVSAEFRYHFDRLHNPERVYYDILDAHPNLDGKRFHTEVLDEGLLKRIRVAETKPEVTRIVLDLVEGVEIHTSQLHHPERLIIELHKEPGAPAPSETRVSPASSAPGRSTPISAPPKPELPKPGVSPVKEPPVVKADANSQVTAEPSHAQMSATPVPLGEPVQPIPTPLGEPAKPASVTPQAASKTVPSLPPASPASAPDPERLPAKEDSGGEPELTAVKPAPAPAAGTIAENRIPLPKPVGEKPVERSVPVPDTAAETGRAARHTSQGQTSLVRALGLKINRVVIDPGHGGHDQGTSGPHGLLEKDLVLDVALRLGKLIEDRMQAEVIYTRSDDTFIPLEGRTALANEKKADLFLSIHANSSSAVKVSGVETYYLNFNGSKDAMDVAARENATSQKSIFELRDLIQKITQQDKAEESHEFASRVQSALYAFSARNFPREKNRGVRSAPFVVLIGANMPSVLAEIGFLSNPREEMLLRKPDYRQRLAEALFRGVQRYADSLSHFQVAQKQ